jgi:hypothetical protein
VDWPVTGLARFGCCMLFMSIGEPARTNDTYIHKHDMHMHSKFYNQSSPEEDGKMPGHMARSPPLGIARTRNNYIHHLNTHLRTTHTHTSACTFRGRKTARARGAVASMWARTWYSSLCMGMTFSLRVMPMSRQKALIAAAETPRRLKPEEWCAYLCVRVSTCVCICLQGGCLLSACAGVYRLLPDSPFPPGKIYIFQNIAPPSPRKKIYFTGTASLFSRASFQLIIEIGIRVLAPGQTQLLMQA